MDSFFNLQKALRGVILPPIVMPCHVRVDACMQWAGKLSQEEVGADEGIVMLLLYYSYICAGVRYYSIGPLCALCLYMPANIS